MGEQPLAQVAASKMLAPNVRQYSINRESFFG
jgi:hypothetical protein